MNLDRILNNNPSNETVCLLASHIYDDIAQRFMVSEIPDQFKIDKISEYDVGDIERYLIPNSHAIHAYKIVDENMRCNYYQYVCDDNHTHTDEVILCKQGFHSCLHPYDTFRFYDLIDGNNRIFKVKIWGEICSSKSERKMCSEHIRIIAEIPRETLFPYKTVSFRLNGSWNSNKIRTLRFDDKKCLHDYFQPADAIYVHLKDETRPTRYFVHGHKQRFNPSLLAFCVINWVLLTFATFYPTGIFWTPTQVILCIIACCNLIADDTPFIEFTKTNSIIMYLIQIVVTTLMFVGSPVA